MSPWMYGVTFILISIMCFIAWNIGNYNGFCESCRICSQFFERLRQTNAEQVATIKDLSATIDRLTAQLQEARDMARKPLTEEQLSRCQSAGGTLCPRCENEEISEMSFGDVEEVDEDSSELFQDVTCDCCQEEWQLRFKLVAVKAGADS